MSLLTVNDEDFADCHLIECFVGCKDVDELIPFWGS